MENLENCDIVCYSDAALGNLNDGTSSTGGYIVFLRDRTSNKSCVIDWQSNKIKRVVNSTLAAESLALIDGIHASLLVRELIVTVTNINSDKLEIMCIVDNKSAVLAANTTTNVSDKRLLRDIATIKELVNSKEVKRIEWLPGDQQLANVLTKRGANGYDLWKVVQSGDLSGFLPIH